MEATNKLYLPIKGQPIFIFSFLFSISGASYLGASMFLKATFDLSQSKFYNTFFQLFFFLFCLYFIKPQGKIVYLP